ncbi:MAG: hypothetical protein HOV81_21645 [Kofleriaceae bacterium]|nr:hypothetical protein [Kofleriaceae bacterium]
MKTNKRTSASKGRGKGTKAPNRAARATPKRAKAKPRPKAKAKKAKPAKRATGGTARWVKFVEKHGIVLASAKGPVPCVAEAVAGEPIVGSWWAHPKGKAIFAALSAIDDSSDVRCFKLVDGKVTFAHRKTWPALVRLGADGVIAAEQLAAVQQEHMPSGEHRNITTPFPKWVDEPTQRAADALSAEKARAQLAWIEG